MDITKLYDKEILDKVEICLYDLVKTGSHTDSENQVIVVKVSESLAYSMKNVYDSKSITSISELKIESDESNQYKVYCSSSYGSSQLLDSIGELLYYSNEFGVEFDGQY